MKNHNKTRTQLVNELLILHQQIAEFKISEVQRKKAEDLLKKVVTEGRQAEEALHKVCDDLGLRVQKRTKELTIIKKALLTEIAQRKQIEGQVNSTNTLLKLFTKESSRKEYLDSVVELIRSWSGCCCVGIRILDKYGKIPYES